MSSSPAFTKHPQHKIIIIPHEGLVTVRFNGIEVARTIAALNMAEGNYPAVYYIPFADCRSEHFTKSTHTTFCPFKGTATYWTLHTDAVSAENCVWGYEEPFDEVAAIAGHVAFYADKVKIEMA